MSSDTAAQSIGSQPIDTFLAALSDKVPTPGGGASAALTGATAAATAGMVVSYSLGKKSLSEHEQTNRAAQAQLTRARRMFLQLGDEDAEGYGLLNTLWKLDKNDPRRVEQWDEAVRGALAPPRAMLALSLDLLALCERLVGTTNRQLKSDLGVAGVLAEAAARSSAWSVRINIPLLPQDQQQDALDTVDEMLRRASARCARIEAGCA